MKTLSLAEFHAAIREQDSPSVEEVGLVCPMCGTVQTGRDLIEAGAGENFDAVEKYLGFSCVGRWTDAGAPRNAPDGEPCNWTLGGLFQTHKLEVVTEDGKRHPRFEVATKAQMDEYRANKLISQETF